MRDKYTDSIRIGIVSDIFPERGTAKVAFTDRDDLVSRELPVVVPCTLEDRWYYMPDIGERVRCLFDPEAPTRGCILGSYYDDVRTPPIGNKNKAYVRFKDETHIEYDRESHKLTVHIPEAGELSIEVVAESDISVNSNGNVVVEAAKDIEVMSAQTITIMALQDINISAAQNINIDAADDVNINAAAGVNITAQDPILIKSSTLVQLQGATSTLVVP